ncbi:hypothetical protein A464_2396 [Salmonella bongori N268-08]|uniref:Uncharacterized protein n=1 Tax=Salmonella bongori N268-08 TaxID=1197719 RepID=S5MSC0_SALBN|nr:hypothetical protein A464_2396 [Salmonella bongori N268-08]
MVYAIKMDPVWSVMPDGGVNGLSGLQIHRGIAGRISEAPSGN